MELEIELIFTPKVNKIQSTKINIVNNWRVMVVAFFKKEDVLCSGFIMAARKMRCLNKKSCIFNSQMKLQSTSIIRRVKKVVCIKGLRRI